MISKRASSINPSVTLEISAKAKALKSEGYSIITFTAGEPDFNTPEYINNSAKLAIDAGYTKYTPASGITELKKEIIKKYKGENELDFTLNQIVISTGAKSSLFHALYVLIDEGDEVIIPAPYWVTYVEQVKLCGGKSVIVDTNAQTNYKITPKALEDAITDKTKCFIFNSPCNPTGVVYTVEEINEIAKVLEKHNVYCISDEIYEVLNFTDNKYYSIAKCSDYMKEHTVIINGVSKTYAMTGWRIGYMVAPSNIAKAVSNVQSHTTSNACSISQYASVTAISSGNVFAHSMVKVFDKRRRIICQELKKIDLLSFIEPQGAFYVFVCIDKIIGKKYKDKEIKGSFDLANALLDEGVAVIPGLAFGFDNFIRLSYALSENDIIEGVKRISNFVNSLK